MTKTWSCPIHCQRTKNWLYLVVDFTSNCLLRKNSLLFLNVTYSSGSSCNILYIFIASGGALCKVSNAGAARGASPVGTVGMRAGGVRVHRGPRRARRPAGVRARRSTTRCFPRRSRILTWILRNAATAQPTA